jgi:NAD(P)-dependent dehydrogenase (short-subunit alcohol dehydrogenase family)
VNLTALITGAAKRIGRDTALTLAGRGNRIARAYAELTAGLLREFAAGG